MSDGKVSQLIKRKRAFLRQAKQDYSAGGNDMLDDIDNMLNEAKTEMTHNLELASVVREEDGEEAYQKECYSMFTTWFEKWFGKP